VIRWRRKPRPVVVPGPDIQREIAALAAAITTVHREVFRPGRDCDLDDDGRCAAIRRGRTK